MSLEVVAALDEVPAYASRLRAAREEEFHVRGWPMVEQKTAKVQRATRRADAARRRAAAKV